MFKNLARKNGTRERETAALKAGGGSPLQRVAQPLKGKGKVNTKSKGEIASKAKRKNAKFTLNNSRLKAGNVHIGVGDAQMGSQSSFVTIRYNLL